ncbi:MAG TPA: diacylglycerol kinase family protein [Candidatus Dormibacteraeota bacterium]|nr:diacylglycerol kinase family protein [Candidatus Dormibacteraeota bacterium]
MVNPGARGDLAEALGRAEAIAASAGWEASVQRTDMRGHAFILAGEAAHAGSDLVVAVGGDGTVREVAAGLAGTGVPLAIVAAGSGNSSYLELFGSSPWEETMGMVLRDFGVRQVDLIELQPTGEFGLLGFSAGWFAQVVKLAATARSTGAARYAEAAGSAAAAPARFAATVRADGAMLAEGDLGLVAIGGARVRASVFPVFPASSMDDGLLEVLTVQATDTAGFNDVLGAVMTGAHLVHPLANYARARRVEISAPMGMLAEIDGDVWERDLYSVDVACAAGQLTVATTGARPPAT